MYILVAVLTSAFLCSAITYFDPSLLPLGYLLAAMLGIAAGLAQENR